jgi:hypothetical protein
VTAPSLITGGTVELRDNKDIAFAWAALRNATQARKTAEVEEARAREIFDRMIGDNDTITADGKEQAVYRHDGRFSTKRFSEDLPHLATQYTKWHAVSYLDEEALAADHPMLFEQYRARTLRPVGDAR